MDSQGQMLSKPPLVLGLIALLVTAMLVYGQIYFDGECTSPVAFLFALISIVLLSFGICIVISETLEKVIGSYNMALLVTIIIGIVIILFDYYVIFPFADGMVPVLFLPILGSVFTLFLTGLLCILSGIYKFIKK